jgi:predicted metal-dependent hydrolase
MRIQQYVVAHELAHHSDLDHSAAFWTVVDSLDPDYEDRREWLRLNGSTLAV